MVGVITEYLDNMHGVTMKIDSDFSVVLYFKNMCTTAPTAMLLSDVFVHYCIVLHLTYRLRDRVIVKER